MVPRGPFARRCVEVQAGVPRPGPALRPRPPEDSDLERRDERGDGGKGGRGCGGGGGGSDSVVAWVRGEEEEEEEEGSRDEETSTHNLHAIIPSYRMSPIEPI